MIRWQLPSSGRLIDAIRRQVGGARSARSLKRTIETNGCRVNGQVERFASRRVHRGDQVEFLCQEEEKKSPVYRILFDQEDLFVVDKPAGISSEELISCDDLLLSHRLDKETTGVLLYARTQRAEEELRALFAQRLIEKEYLALVDGRPKQESGLIKSFLAKKGHFQGQTIWGSADAGLYAETAWGISRAFEDRALLLCKPKTGRTHQIRVHLAEMGHPLLVDRQYASRFRSQLLARRPLLHAWRLSLTWRGSLHSFEASLPKDLHEALSHR